MDGKTDLSSVRVEANGRTFTVLNSNAKSKGSRRPEVVLHEVGLLLLFQSFGWNELVNVSGGLLVDAMGDDVRVKLLPVVQAHDAIEYFPLGDCELVVALKKHKQNHTHTHCGLSLKLVFLPQCRAILPVNNTKSLHL